jgi:hypothetical protein
VSGHFFLFGRELRSEARFAPRSAQRDDRPKAHPLAPTNQKKVAALTFSERPFFLFGRELRSEARFAPRSAQRDDRPKAHPLAPTNLSYLLVSNWFVGEQKVF